MKSIEKYKLTYVPVQILSLGGFAAMPQNSGGPSREKGADLPRETADNKFRCLARWLKNSPHAFGGPTKSSLVWREIAKAFEKFAPSFGENGSKA